ncbi:fha domain containing protein [Chrysochromulina tobinii]|uniref:Fha domain containing protein n=1 Tax=Chrysochromulina tobinii TaxID=1460289 RepID=A0A0M0K0I1_9EUKA|nr:fha domain containing protein [Chrysochromulina tobinii]|eukprot:KOO32391.1 fha domain containing protein [Chrysochromulina sp. CCMP291]
MGRHRSTLRDLGWGTSNSPNPWKQGSAKRVVRTLDYSQAEVDDALPVPEEVLVPAEAPRPAAGLTAAFEQTANFDERLNQLQQDGRQQLDRIREQFEAQDAENKRKLERLNGRIAGLAEGKHAMWSALSQTHKPKPGETHKPAAAATVAATTTAAAPTAPEAAAAPSKPADVPKVASIREEAESASEAARRAALERREREVCEREAALVKEEAALADARNKLATREAEVTAREAEAARKLEGLAARERALAAAQSSLDDTVQLAGTGAAAGGVPLTSSSARVAPVAAVPPSYAGAPISTAASSRVEGPSATTTTHSAASEPTGASAQPNMIDAKAKGGKEADARDIVCDNTAEWTRAENLTASLLRQRDHANPDEVFHPLPNQRTCELKDIFSAPRRRDRAQGSGDWTPAAEEAVQPAQQAAKAGGADKSEPQLQLLGTDGEYHGEIIALPGATRVPGCAPKTLLIGRSSSCDVTLSRDDQISRRHLQLEVRDGRLFLRDLGSTYGTRLNGRVLGSEAAEVTAGDAVVIGASSFVLQAIGGA